MNARTVAQLAVIVAIPVALTACSDDTTPYFGDIGVDTAGDVSDGSGDGDVESDADDTGGSDVVDAADTDGDTAVPDATDTDDATDGADAADTIDAADVADGADTIDATDVADAADTADAEDTTEPPVCATSLEPFAGTFCESGCAVAVDQIVDPVGRFRNGAPALALEPDCTPQILFSHSEGGHHGLHALYADAAWDFSETPFSIARANYAMTLDGVGVALVVGSSGVTAHAYDAPDTSGWTNLPTPAGTAGTTGGNLALDADGTPHGAVLASGSAIETISLGDDGWSATGTGITTSAYSFRTVLDSDGSPRVFAWSSVGGGWRIHWTTDSGTEPAFDLGLSFLGARPQRFDAAIGPATEGNPSGVPYILVGEDSETTCDQRISIAHRGEDGDWIQEFAPRVAVDVCDTCSGSPSSEFDTCESDYTTFEPIALLVSAGGDVAALYARRRREESWSASCFSELDCYWTRSGGTITADLVLARPGAAPVTVMEGTATFLEGDVVVDPVGRIHLAVYDDAEGSARLRYIRIDPSP